MQAFVPKFEDLQRVASKAAIMIEGLSGSGKSGLALMLSYGLLGGFKEGLSAEEKKRLWKKIYTIDTENRSLNLFVDIPASFGENFGAPRGLQLTSDIGYNPLNYIAGRERAIAAGAEAVVFDSITHMWNAKGGVLDIVSNIKAKDKNIDNYRVWGLPEVREAKQALLDVIRDHRCHMITTVRVKEKFGMNYDADKGKNVVVSLGEQQLQQDGLKYEPDLVLHMVSPGNVSNGIITHPKAVVQKTRYAIFKKDETYEFTPALCEQLRAYLSEGVSPEELLEQQRQDYVTEITNVLNTNSSKKNIWKVIKENAGVKDTKLQDIPLPVLKQLYSQLIG